MEKETNFSSSDNAPSSSGDASDSYESEQELLPLNEAPSSKLGTEEEEEKEKSLCSAILSWDWKNIGVIGCLAIAYLLCNVSFSTISPFFPEEAAAKGVSTAVVGLIVGSSQLTVAISSPLCGYIIPRTGFVVPTFFGLLIVASTYLSFGFIDNISTTWVFVLICFTLRIMEGLGAAMFYTATLAVIPILFPKHIGTLMGLFELVTGFGYCLGFLLGGILYKIGGFRLPFLSVGSCVLAFTIPCVLLVRKIAMKSKKKTFLPLRTVAHMGKDLVVVVLILGIVSCGSCPAYYSPILQPFLMEQFGYNSVQTSFIFCIGPSLHVTSSFFVGPLVDRVGHNRQFIITGLTIAGSSFVLLGIIYTLGFMNIYVLIFTLVMRGIGIACGLVPAYGDLVHTSEKHLEKDDSHMALTSYISGLISSSIYLGQFLGSFIGGALRNVLSFAMTSTVAGELVLAEAFLLIGVTIVHRYTSP